MKSRPSSLQQALLVVSLGLAVLPASASDDCDAPLSRWQSRDAVRQMAAEQGWQIQRLKIDDGCYEIRGTDASGRAFKAKIDPETLKVLKMKPNDHLRDRVRDRDGGDGGDGEGAARQTRSPPPNGATEPSPSLPTGGAPQGQAK